ncbi:MAG TPA: GAF domain-containing protein [Chthoniobacterales bacterium]|nr:GAF domain-containing protein [Chthoniobacterales bacterium]
MPAKRIAKSSRTPVRPFRRNRKSRALQEIGATVIAGGKGPSVVEEIAELVQRTCKYRWVGVYKIKRHEFVIEAATNKMKPACPQFPVTQGLSARATEERKTVMVPDVRKEPCFLPNFWSTKSEIIVPIIDDEHDRVVGVINVESAKANAFGKSDRDFLEGVARIIWRALR